ncbi:major facilitator superfamily mfs_1 [Stylonychia lemnae]|uniref:Major facilitator superfamily mfs_1 n=1 Tax=Stylonychia lemnae TaxID=5949 RepID=A0A078AV54_STYLE|nr:major facilitator superfamily mfs_1 [Stylonychia lemnae]|eukprot:CDW85142.1 major facilitator superfamily mfs_1 [Stylonychia lemnae]
MNIEERSPDFDIEKKFKPINRGREFMGIKLKEGYTVANLISIPLITASLTVSSFYLGIQIVFILRDPEYFNVPKENIGTVTNSLTFYATFFQIALVIIIGYIYDIFGRKITLLASLIGGAIVLFLLPYTAPNVWPGLYLLRAIYAVFATVGVCSPLINDYVVKESRGKANAFQNSGVIIGELFNLFVLLKLTKDLSNSLQYQLVAVFLILVVGVLVFLMKEPAKYQKKSKTQESLLVKNRKNEDQLSNSSILKNELEYEVEDSFINHSISHKVKYLTKHVIWSLKSNIIFPVCYFGIFLMRMNAVMVVTFYTLWLSGFAGTALKDQDEASELFQEYLTMAVLCVIILIVPVGKMSDRFKYKDLIPWIGSINVLAIYLIYQIKDPKSFEAMIVFVLMTCSLFMQNLLTDTLFQKNIPKDIRGSMIGCYNFVGIIAILFFSKIGGYLHDQYGSQYPFVFVGVFQVAFILIIIILGLTNKFNS